MIAPVRASRAGRPTVAVRTTEPAQGEHPGAEGLADPRAAELLRIREALNGSPRVVAQRKLAASLNEPRDPWPPIQTAQPSNPTGLPAALQAGIESLSGLSVDDVRVHENSARPKALRAAAYTQGSEIHLGPGRSRDLPHEAWHAVQQKQGRVQPTLHSDGVAINDDAGLEAEADSMGRRALEHGHALERSQPRPGPPGNAGAAVAQARLADGAVARTPSWSAPVVQRTVDVTDIDYDPVAQEYRNGIIETQVFTTLQGLIQSDDALAGYRAQLTNVIQHVRGQNFAAPDVDQLADAIRNAVVARYAHHGYVLGAGPSGRVLAHAVTAVTQNIRADHAVAMDDTERTAFDQLVGIVGAGAMSRAKQHPTPIRHNQLPGTLQGRVDAVLDELRTENARWTAGSLDPQPFLATFHLMPDIANRIGSYQGNHTNNAGWLPAVATPVRHLNDLRDHVGRRVWSIVRAPRASERLAYTGDHPGRTRLQREYEDGIAAAYGAMDDAAVKLMAWAELAAGVSAYIELNMPGGLSRLCFDPVNDRIYITAHYKWRNGYNPFFKVTDFPDL